MECSKEITIIFFSELNELLSLGLTLQKSLSLISKSANLSTKCKNLSKNILQKVSQGFEFYVAADLYCNKKLINQYAPLFNSDFDCNFLQKTLSFICKQHKQEQAQKQKIIAESIYPLFLFIISLGLSAFLYNSKELFAFSNATFNSKDFVLSLFFLVIFATSFFCVSFFVQNNSFEYDFFNSLNFLLNNNLEITEAINICMMNYKSGQFYYKYARIQKFFYELKTFLLQGKSFYFAIKNSKLFSKNTLNFLELNEWGNSLQNCISLIVNNLEKTKQNRISTFSKLSEPTLICGIGIYLFLLIKNTVLPFFIISENTFF